MISFSVIFLSFFFITFFFLYILLLLCPLKPGSYSVATQLFLINSLYYCPSASTEKLRNHNEKQGQQTSYNNNQQRPRNSSDGLHRKTLSHLSTTNKAYKTGESTETLSPAE